MSHFNYTQEEDLGNPFADPSISHALGSGYTSNDFEATPYNLHSSSSTLNDSRPASPPPQKGGIQPPQPSFDASHVRAAASLNAREDELRKREEELAAREAALARERESMRAAGLHPPNWPKFYPLFYHDIDAEVPEGYKPTVKKLYQLWLGTQALLVFNMVACLLLLITHPDNLEYVASGFGVSLVYIPFIGACSLYLWYRPVYWSYTRSTALYTYIYLLFGGLHILFAFYMAVGIPGSGGAGFINALAALTNGKVLAGVFCFVAMGGWVMSGLWSLWLWKVVHGHTMEKGHTLQAAKSEAISYGVRSGVAQDAAGAYVMSNDGNFNRV
ncbi:hypothetical protein HK104_009133 [Borealophlyctis nickersoniae]|nr:hypothetical protein HK104_009133 [Borealophlyctis nickersoniae]